MITFKCPNCQREARAADEHAGKKAKCPKCNHVFQIPAPAGQSKKPSANAAPPAKTKPTAPTPPPKAAAAAPKPPAKKAPPPPEEDEDEDVEEVAEAVEEDEDEDEDQEDFDFDKKKPSKKKAKKPKRKFSGRAGEWAPCPKCGATDASRVYFSWWGGWLAPLMFNMVSCHECGTQYNGRSGGSLTTPMIIFLIPGVIALVALLGCGVLSAILGNL